MQKAQFSLMNSLLGLRGNTEINTHTHTHAAGCETSIECQLILKFSFYFNANFGGAS